MSTSTQNVCRPWIFLAAMLLLVTSANAGYWSTNGAMNSTRYSHTATLLPNGKVLVAGGLNPGYTSSAEIFDPATGTWAATASMTTNRSQHTATLLPNGKVLVVGGYLQSGFDSVTLSSAELYDPVAGTWTLTGSMTNPRAGHTATLLPNGKVLVAGGYVETNFTSASIGSAEIYDPATGVWTPTANELSFPRNAHTATLLPNGKVLVAGGYYTNLLYSAELFDPATGSWSATGSMKTNRLGHTATLLPNGQVLVTGGQAGSSTSAAAELYNPTNGTWTLISPMSVRRQGHSANLLPNGTVLITGGTYLTTTYNTTEIYNPTTGSWSSGGTMANMRAGQTTTLLPSGRLLAAGGYYLSGFDTIPISSTEIYEPAVGAWSLTSNSIIPRADHSATLLPNGKVLLAGGYPDQSGNLTNSAELYDPTLGTWTNTGAMTFPRAQHTATLLPNGKVLVIHGQTSGDTNGAELYDPASGTWTLPSPIPITSSSSTTMLTNGLVLVTCGATNSNYYPTNSAIYNYASNTWTLGPAPNVLSASHSATLLSDGRVLLAGGTGFLNIIQSRAELYDPLLGTWTTTGSMSSTRYGQGAVLLPNGKVLVAGGYLTNSVPLATAELYNPQTGTWSPTGSMNSQRAAHTLTLLPNGKVLAAGGIVSFAGFFSTPVYTNSTELYDPATGTWTPTAPLATARGSHTATLLPNGKILIAGGRTNSSGIFLGPTSLSEIYDPGLGFSNAWQPQISGSPQLNLGGSLALTGSRFRGISGASGGTTQDSPSDYPVVQIRSIESGQTLFLPAQNWSTNSFVSTAVTNFPVGYALATVFVNGIPSVSQIVPVNATAAAIAIYLENAKLSGGFFQFSFTNTPGAVFTALTSTNLTSPLTNWTALGAVPEISPGLFQFTDPQPATTTRRFYGVRSP